MQAKHLALGVFITSLMACPVLAQGTLVNGDECGTFFPGITENTINQQDNKCKSGRCFPGPGPGGVTLRAYCIAVDRHCALPGADGAYKGTVIEINASPHLCWNDVAGRMRFRP